MHRFKHDGYDACWDGLTKWQRPLRGAKRKAAKALLQYAAQREDMIRYPEFRRNNWQIGSVPTEGLLSIELGSVGSNRWRGFD